MRKRFFSRCKTSLFGTVLNKYHIFFHWEHKKWVANIHKLWPHSPNLDLTICLFDHSVLKNTALSKMQKCSLKSALKKKLMMTSYNPQLFWCLTFFTLGFIVNLHTDFQIRHLCRSPWVCTEVAWLTAPSLNCFKVLIKQEINKRDIILMGFCDNISCGNAPPSFNLNKDIMWVIKNNIVSGNYFTFTILTLSQKPPPILKTHQHPAQLMPLWWEEWPVSIGVSSVG